MAFDDPTKPAGEEQTVFGISPMGTGDGVPLVIIGMSKAARKFCANGKTHSMDLTPIGIPIKIVIFGGDTRDGCKNTITAGARAAGQPPLDMDHRDFSVKPKLR